MFTKTLATLALAATAFALPSAPGGLKVSVSAPESLSSLDGLKVIASVTNTGTDDVTILNYNSVLDAKRPTQSFQVAKGGETVPFTGLKVYLDLKRLDESAFTTIKAGETVSVEHDLSSLYDFEGARAGDFTFTPNAHLRVVTDKAEGKSTLFNFEHVPTAAVRLSGDLARRELPGLTKRTSVSCSDSTKKSKITSAYAESKTLAGYARDYATSNSSSQIFKDTFKTNSGSTVASRFSALVSENGSGRTLNCSDPYGECAGGVVAYTDMGGARPIYFCDFWFQFPLPTSNVCSQGTGSDQDSAAAVLLHEMTHAVHSTDDLGYGCDFDKGLSASQALNNADTYNCFAMKVFLNTRC